MKIIARLLFGVALLAAGSCFAVAADKEQHNQPPEGFIAIFNGKDLSGWHGMGHFDPRKLWAMSEEERAAKRASDMKNVREHWTVEDGELVNDGHGVYLTTDKDYGDIELWIDYKTVPKADSGIYLRGTPQVQIWDYTKEGGKWNLGADKGSGGLWNNSKDNPGKDPLVLADKPFGEWNRFHIIQIGDRTKIWLDDKLVVDDAVMENYWDRSKPLFEKGPLQLQTHGGEIRWRNIFLREIPPEEAAATLREWDAKKEKSSSTQKEEKKTSQLFERPAVPTSAQADTLLALAPQAEQLASAAEGSSGFEPIFNGKDFTGWTGATQNYEVVDGAIRCQPGKGGALYTEKEYGDFIVQLDFKLPPGGNNGLAIRYPGKGDPAYAGMCELQVLDNTAEKYAKLDPRQYHGSAYGMVAAERGHLRKPGEWNSQTVTVQGSKIKVELNGAVILDTDLSKVTEYMGNRPHPGKDRPSGHFGFAGHGDAVEFRNIFIKTLK